MKNFNLLALMFTLALFSSKLFAHPWEIAFRIVNGGSYVSNFTVYIYSFNTATGEWNNLIGVTSVSYEIHSDCNICCDQYTYNGNVYTPDSGYPDVPYAEKYLFRFGNKCVIYKRTGTLTPDDSGDWSVTYDTGSQQISEGPTERTGMWTSEGTFDWVDYTFTLKNDFNAGNILFRDTYYSSGTQLTRQGSSFPHEVYASADNQIVNNYKRYFKLWTTPNYNTDDSDFWLETWHLYPSSSSDVTASFAKLCNLYFEYYYEGATRSGYMVIGDTTRSLPTTVYRRSDAYVNAAASDQEYLSIIYSFDHWNKNSSNIGGTASYTFQPDAHATYTAYLIPSKPTNTYRNLQFRNPDNSSPTVGSNI